MLGMEIKVFELIINMTINAAPKACSTDHVAALSVQWAQHNVEMCARIMIEMYFPRVAAML